MDEEKYFVVFENGWVKTNTLSPNKNYFYRITQPIVLNKSAFGCHISFFTTKNELLYNRNSQFVAHELHSTNEINEMKERLRNGEIDFSIQKGMEFVKWSIEGNFAYILEYNLKRASYESVILNLKAKCCYRFLEGRNDSEFSFTDLVDIQFSDKEVEELVNSYEIAMTPLITDKFPHRNMFGFKTHKWHPII